MAERYRHRWRAEQGRPPSDTSVKRREGCGIRSGAGLRHPHA